MSIKPLHLFSIFVAFCVRVLARQMVELGVVEIGLISASEVCELPGEISCSHLFICAEEREGHLQTFTFKYLNPAPGLI